MDILHRTIDRISGVTPLTREDLERAVLVGNGFKFAKVAEARGVTTDTIKSTFKALRQKLSITMVVGHQSWPVIWELMRRKHLVWNNDRTYLIINKTMWRDDDNFNLP